MRLAVAQADRSRPRLMSGRGPPLPRREGWSEAEGPRGKPPASGAGMKAVRPFVARGGRITPGAYRACFPGFRIMKMTAATQMAIPTAIRAVSASPNSTVPIRMAVSGSNTPRTAVFVGPI